MKENQLFLAFPFSSLEEFNENQAALFDKVLQGHLQSLTPTASHPIFLTRKETSFLLKISLTSLNEYTKNGTLCAYRIGGRVLYKQEGVEAALKQMKFNI